jgi:hypothetical protein
MIVQGDVGIGTDSPGAKLDVAGSIRGSSIVSDRGSISLASGTYGLIINIPNVRSNFIINVIGTNATNQTASNFILSAIISRMPGNQNSQITVIKAASLVEIRVVNNTEIEVRQNSGATQTMSWSILRLF